MNFVKEPQIDVSVIYVNYNTFNPLCNSVDSVISNTFSISYEIIIVDNSSNDNSCQALLAKYGSTIKILPLSSNIGFGNANNEGVNVARGRNIFFLNPDTILLNNAIKILSDYIDNHPNIGIAGGNLYDCELNPAYSFRHFLPCIFWEFNDLFFSLPEKILYGRNRFFNTSQNPVNVAYITGADMMIPKSIFEKAGFFDKKYFLYFEETDLAYRVKRINLKIINIPNARIIHLEGESFNIESSRIRHYLTGKLIYYKNHFGRKTNYILNCIFQLTAYSRMVIFTLLMKKTKYNRWKILLQYYKELRKGIEHKPLIN